jgi:arylformamidase
MDLHTTCFRKFPCMRQRKQSKSVRSRGSRDRHWRTDACFEGHPYLTERAADWLAKAGAVLVGIDPLNIESVATGERPVHSVLLGSEIPIVERMRGLASLAAKGSRFFAVPVKVKAFRTFPVRALAVV